MGTPLKIWDPEKEVKFFQVQEETLYYMGGLGMLAKAIEKKKITGYLAICLSA